MVYRSTYRRSEMRYISLFSFSFCFWYSWDHKALRNNLLTFLMLSWGWYFCATLRDYLWGLCPVLCWQVVVLTVGAETAFSLLFQLTIAASIANWILFPISIIRVSSISRIKNESLRWYMLKSLPCRMGRQWVTQKSQVLSCLRSVFWKVLSVARLRCF